MPSRRSCRTPGEEIGRPTSIGGGAPIRLRGAACAFDEDLLVAWQLGHSMRRGLGECVHNPNLARFWMSHFEGLRVRRLEGARPRVEVQGPRFCQAGEAMRN